MSQSNSIHFSEPNPYAPGPDDKFTQGFLLMLRLELWVNFNKITGKYDSTCEPRLTETGECCEVHHRLVEEQTRFINEMKRLAEPAGIAHRIKSLKWQSLVHFCRATSLTPQIIQEATRKRLGMPDTW